MRIHLQVAKFMTTPNQPNQSSLVKLKELVQLAERLGLYLDVTGLGCYHKADTPAWYDELDEEGRWKVQANFWREVAATCNGSPAIFCYDLMNEPILPSDKPGEKPEKEWLAGGTGRQTFCPTHHARHARSHARAGGRSVGQKLTEAIRAVDKEHLITVGVIPWSHVFPGAKPIFYAPGPAKYLDFVSIHIYPKWAKFSGPWMP